jgi:enamine deaminase RidA (YjgF/YER057c/UK114 family)
MKHSITLSIGLLVLAALGAGTSLTQERTMTVEHLNPDGLHANPAFSQAVAVRGPHSTVYVGGQNAVSSAGEIVGKGDVAAQAAQVAENLGLALEAAGATFADVVRWNVYAVQGQPVGPALGAFQAVIGDRMPKPPAISVLFVAGLAHPDFLLEVDAVAVIPD